MDQVLIDFLRVLRGAGLRVSPPEAIDAAEAIQLLGYGDRLLLKEGLSIAVAKSPAEREAFSQCFDRFFSLEMLGDGTLAGKGEPPAQEGESPLVAQLLAGNRAGLAAALRIAAGEVKISELRLSTQRGIYLGRLLRQMGIDAVDQEIQRLRREETVVAGERAEALARSRAVLVDWAREFVEKQYQLFGRPHEEQHYERRLSALKLSDLEQRDLHRMNLLLQRMVKRLRDEHSRRRSTYRRGQLDFRRTLRSNVTAEGLLFDLHWKRRRIDRPEVVALCDVSSSVASVARFLLLFLYSLKQRLAGLRTFTFCSNLVEVTRVFETYPVEEALARLKRGTGVGIQMGPTDYGQALRDFHEGWLDIVTKRTTLLILGDARNNDGNPEVGLLRNLYQKSKRVLWLNPESPSSWGTGDSEMMRYLPYCHLARECNTVQHLERVVDALLDIR